MHYTNSENIPKTTRERWQVTNIHNLFFTETAVWALYLWILTIPSLIQWKIRHKSRAMFLLTKWPFSWPSSHFTFYPELIYRAWDQPHSPEQKQNKLILSNCSANRIFSCSSHGLFNLLLQQGQFCPLSSIKCMHV